MLKGITVNATKILRRNDVSSTEMGKKADFFLDDNTLVDIEALKKVHQVIQGGKEILS